MTAHATEMSVAPPCHACGYDLRGHAADGNCPECGTPVAEARRFAAVPARPAWRDSDPRWRRRVLAGAWLLALLPLMGVLDAFKWSSRVPVPRILDLPDGYRALNNTLLSERSVYEPLAFCVGVVLLFSKERGRRRDRLDWTRRWGVLCCYVVLLLSATQVFFLAAMVLTGISASFQSMPLKYQPEVTPLFIRLSTTYMRYGPHPMSAAGVVQVAFSSIAILLACLPLFDALRSSGRKRLAAALLAPLALFSLMHLAQAAWYSLGISGATEFFRYGVYFWPEAFVSRIGDRPAWRPASGSVVAVVVELVKWCTVLGVAVWLSIAQVAACRRRGEAGTS
jgi:predicted RNA-binding Zn-ribbon protein involved in translation (DUF1610 family)